MYKKDEMLCLSLEMRHVYVSLNMHDKVFWHLSTLYIFTHVP
jgi:hypothetical protein